MAEEIKINDDLIANEAIESAPAVTYTERDNDTVKAEIVGTPPIKQIAIDANRAQADAQAVNSGIESAYKGFTNENLDDSQKQIFSSFFGAVFEYLQGRNISPLARVGIFGSMALLAVSPTIFKMLNAGKAVENGNQ